MPHMPYFILAVTCHKNNLQCQCHIIILSHVNKIKYTLTRTNRACSDVKALVSTSTTRPTPLPISRPTSSESKSNGKPQICIHIGRTGKVTELAVPSKLQGPLLITHVSWLSSANLNWNRPSPTSMIFSSGPSFHADRSNHILWLLAGCRVVWWENDQASSMHILQVFSLVETSPPWPLHPPPPSGLSFESSQWSLNPCGVRLLRCCQ